MQVSVTISGFSRLFDNDMSRVLDAARQIDDAGAHQLVLADHVVMGDRTDRYPFGTFPYGPEEPWPEPITLLAAIAAVTERVRLGTGILITPLRPPALLAKMVATLDQISKGRVDLGVGTGWQREEYAAAGIPWQERWSRLDDGLRACAALWTQAPPVTFAGSTLSFGPTWCAPQPVQRAPISGVPLWFGVAAEGEHIRRIAELGAGWLPIHTTTPDELRAGIVALRAAVGARGRDPQTFGVRSAATVVWRDDDTNRLDIDATRAANAWLAEIGVTSASLGTGRTMRVPGGLVQFVADAVEAFGAL
jgi:probable F420-dependent oxidoreductase